MQTGLTRLGIYSARPGLAWPDFHKKFLSPAQPVTSRAAQPVQSSILNPNPNLNRKCNQKT